jgi:hypothetical protein
MKELYLSVISMGPFSPSFGWVFLEFSYLWSLWVSTHLLLAGRCFKNVPEEYSIYLVSLWVLLTSCWLGGVSRMFLSVCWLSCQSLPKVLHEDLPSGIGLARSQPPHAYYSAQQRSTYNIHFAHTTLFVLWRCHPCRCLVPKLYNFCIIT